MDVVVVDVGRRYDDGVFMRDVFFVVVEIVRVVVEEGGVLRG